MGRFAILAYVPLRSGCNHIFGPDIGVRLGPCRRPERQSIGKVQRCNIIFIAHKLFPRLLGRQRSIMEDDLFKRATRAR